MEFQIPQFIEEETKFIGPFTPTQFWILLVAGGLSVFTWLILGSLLLKIFLIALYFGIAAVLAFGKIDGLPIYSLVGHAIKHFWLPRYYFWTREHIPTSQTLKKKKTIIKLSAPSLPIKEKISSKIYSEKDIKNIAQALDIKRKKQ